MTNILSSMSVHLFLVVRIMNNVITLTHTFDFTRNPLTSQLNLTAMIYIGLNPTATTSDTLYTLKAVNRYANIAIPMSL